MRLTPYQGILVAFSALTAAVLVYVSLLNLVAPPGGVEVIGFVTGLAVMWFLDVSTSNRFWERRSPAEVIIDVTPEFQNTSIQLLESNVRSEPEHDALARDLLDTDPALALARIRIEIERRLREMQPADERPQITRGIRGTVEALVQRGRLPAELIGPIDQVVSMCNQAVHGASVTRALAADVIQSGERIFGLLEKYRCSSG
jgi:hypothetical protein